MDFNSEMNAISKTEVGSSYIDTPGVYVVTIKGYKLVSPDKGTPYLEVTFETQPGENQKTKINIARLYRTKEGDSPESAEWKMKRIKELLENAGADFGKQGEEVIRSVIGKQVKVLFKNEEYIGYDKDNYNRPEVRTKISYSFSKPASEELTGNQSYLHSKLSESDAKKLEGELLVWNRDYGQSDAPQQTATSPQEPVQTEQPQQTEQQAPAPTQQADDDFLS